MCKKIDPSACVNAFTWKLTEIFMDTFSTPQQKGLEIPGVGGAGGLKSQKLAMKMYEAKFGILREVARGRSIVILWNYTIIIITKDTTLLRTRG